ncbi:MAG: FKBP-type peptidyl-prolyl cis-trans isomerase [bacterium]|nr:FKBP-type peptidyl-prolyl cis-trans isomerase [bacterium]
MENNNKNMVWWVIIVLLVVGGLIYITVNKNPENSKEEGLEENKNLSNLDTNEAPIVGDTLKDNVTVDTTTPATNNTNKVIIQNGLKITVLKEGTGIPAKSGDTVAMNYTGKLTNGTIFDSNVLAEFKHVQPFPFTIDAGEVIKGWDLGVIGMKVGEKRILEISPELGYGSQAVGGVIPANSTLIFEVELLAIKK